MHSTPRSTSGRRGRSANEATEDDKANACSGKVERIHNFIDGW